MDFKWMIAHTENKDQSAKADLTVTQLKNIKVSVLSPDGDHEAICDVRSIRLEGEQIILDIDSPV